MRPLNIPSNDRGRLGRIPVVRVVRRRLVVPRHLAGVDIERNERRREEVVSLTAARCVRRRRVTRPEDVQLGLGIVHARNPRGAVAVPRRVQAGPCLEARIALFLGRRVPNPLHGARARIERFQKRRGIEVVASANEQMVADRHRRVRREVLLVERGHFVAPDFLAVLGIESNNPIIVLGEVNEVSPHRQATSPKGCATARLPVVVPQDSPVTRIDSKDVVGRCRVDNSVHSQNATADARGAAGVRFAVAETTDDDWIARTAAAATTAASSATTAASTRRAGTCCQASPVRTAPLV